MKLFIALLLGLSLVGCSHSQIMKECKQVEDEELYVCKTIKPWN